MLPNLKSLTTRGVSRLFLLGVLPLAPLATSLLGACSVDTQPTSEAVGEESAALSQCVTNPSACVGNSDPCTAACSAHVCKLVKVAGQSCSCTGPCGAGLTCEGGSCEAPPPPPPVCTGPQPAYRTWWVPGAHNIEFSQLNPGEAPNPDTQCFSGCGPTAWAMFFAQADSKWRGLGYPSWTTNASWFQAFPNADGSIGWPNDNYAQITMDISHHLGTSCGAPATNGAYTEPTWMASAGDYISQGPETSYVPHGPSGGYENQQQFTYQYDTHNTDDSLVPDYLNDYGTLDYARDWIINHGYAVVYGYYVGGVNVIGNAHYALATGYQEKATAWSCERVNGAPQWVVTNSDNTNWQFYMNGGGGDSDGWRSPPAYYVGTIKIDKK